MYVAGSSPVIHPKKDLAKKRGLFFLLTKFYVYLS